MRMTGHVDTERRPLLRVELPDGEPILALIDTGFDGTLAFSEADAIACGVDIDPYYRDEVFVIGRRPSRSGTASSASAGWDAMLKSAWSWT